MKTKRKLASLAVALVITGSLADTVMGQSVETFALWSFTGGNNSSFDATAISNSIADCATHSRVTYNGGGSSYQTRGFDGAAQGSNCFAGWGTGDSSWITFEVDFSGNITGQQLSFYVGRYATSIAEGDTDPDSYRLEFWRNGIQENGNLLSNTIDFAGLNDSTAAGPAWDASAYQSVDISGLSFSTGDSVEFRLYSPNGSSKDGRLAIDEFAITGAKTVPEPSSTVLIGLSGMALMFRRRK